MDLHTLKAKQEREAKERKKAEEKKKQKAASIKTTSTTEPEIMEVQCTD